MGLSYIMSQLSVKGPIKFTSTAIGWATAEFIMTRFAYSGMSVLSHYVLCIAAVYRFVLVLVTTCNNFTVNYFIPNDQLNHVNCTLLKLTCIH